MVPATKGKEDKKIYSRLERLRKNETTGQDLSDAILGANDGIITTFVVVAGAVGATLGPIVILIIGFANVLGDAVSMGFGNYLGRKSQADYHKGQREDEERQIETHPKEERQEIRKIFSDWGFKSKDLDKAVEIVTADKKVWVDVMMKEELGVMEQESGHAKRSGLVTFIAFVIAGCVPLLPFLFPLASGTATFLATVLSGAELFVIGSLRSLVTPVKWFKAGVEMLLVGAIAGGLAYAVGTLLDRIVGSVL